LACRSCHKFKLLLQSSRNLLVCRLCHKFKLLLQSSRNLLACRSCRGGQLLLPVTAKVTKNALGCESPLRRTLRQFSAVPASHRRAPPNSRMAQTCGGARCKKVNLKADLFAIPSVHNIQFCGFGVRPGPADCDLTGVYDDLRVWEAEYKG
jgi:hypothetical protein